MTSENLPATKSTISNLSEFKAKHGLSYSDIYFMFRLDPKEKLQNQDVSTDEVLLDDLQKLDVIIDRYKTVKEVFTDIDAQQALKTIENQTKEIERLKALIPENILQAGI